MTPGKINLIAHDTKRESGFLHRISMTAQSRRQRQLLERAAVDASEAFEALKSAATQEGYHNGTSY